MNLQQSQLEVLTTEILIFKQQTAVNIIEIGRRLIQAKEMLPHGVWGKWLEERVEFTDRTAQRFMLAAREFSNTTAMSGLSSTKVIALLDVPTDERDRFIQEPHQLPTGEIKTVDEMTTRELQAEVKARKAAEKAAAEAASEKERLAEENAELRQANRELEETAKTNKPQVIEKVIEKQVSPPDYHSTKIQVETFKQRLKEVEEAKTALEKRIDFNKQDAAEYRKLKNDIENLKRDKSDLSRQIIAATELSGLVVEVDHFLKNKLAPIKYSRAIAEQRHDPVVQRNLNEIVSRVHDWCNEMEDLIVRNIKKVEVIDVGRIDNA